MNRDDAAAATRMCPWRRVAATPRPRRGYSVGDESRRRRGRDVDIPWETSRGDAAAATWIFRGRQAAATPRPRRGYSVGDESRGVEIRPSARPRRYLDFPSSAFSRLRPLCAHTKRWIRDDGEERLVGLSVVGKSFAFYEFDETGAVASTTEHELPFATAVTHDFGLTEKYYVVAENPVRYFRRAGTRQTGRGDAADGDIPWRLARLRYAPDVLGGMTGGAPALGRDTIASEGRAGLVALVPRPGVDGDVILVEGFEGVAFHVANAWDTDEDTVSFAACAFDRYSMGSEYAGPAGEGGGKLVRPARNL